VREARRRVPRSAAPRMRHDVIRQSAKITINAASARPTRAAKPEQPSTISDCDGREQARSQHRRILPRCRYEPRSLPFLPVFAFRRLPSSLFRHNVALDGATYISFQQVVVRRQRDIMLRYAMLRGSEFAGISAHWLHAPERIYRHHDRYTFILQNQ